MSRRHNTRSSASSRQVQTALTDYDEKETVEEAVKQYPHEFEYKNHSRWFYNLLCIGEHNVDKSSMTKQRSSREALKDKEVYHKSMYTQGSLRSPSQRERSNAQVHQRLAIAARKALDEWETKIEAVRIEAFNKTLRKWEVPLTIVNMDDYAKMKQELKDTVQRCMEDAQSWSTSLGLTEGLSPTALRCSYSGDPSHPFKFEREGEAPQVANIDDGTFLLTETT